MKNLLLSFFIFMILSGCRVYQEYPRKVFNNNLIPDEPKLEICLNNLQNRVADADSFYVANFLVTQAMSAQKPEDNIPQLDIGPERFYEMMDVIIHNFESNPDAFCEKISILEYEEDSSLPLKLLTAFTMGIPCLVGMPANWTSTAVKIQHACYDDSGNLISSAWAEGYNKTFVAMYWGYGVDARSRSNKLAMQEALENIAH